MYIYYIYIISIGTGLLLVKTKAYCINITYFISRYHGLLYQYRFCYFLLKTYFIVQKDKRIVFSHFWTEIKRYHVISNEYIQGEHFFI